MRRRVTIKDVAKAAGVSFKTVARVVNNDTSVRAANREKVLKAIKALDYQVDVTARNLRSKRSFAIGLVYEHPLAEVQSGVLSACQNNGYSLQIQPCDPAGTDTARILCEAVRHSRLAGLVLTPPISEQKNVIRKLQNNRIHFVCIVSDISTPKVSYPCIYVDDHKAACDITRHLIQLGHRRIGFLWGDASHRSSQQRFLGYCRALEEAGLKRDKNIALDGEYSFDSGRLGATRLLKRGKPPSAIIGCNDEIAAGAIIAARALELKVPGDLSVAGFEDSHYSKCSWPPITTARQPTEDIARQATLLLIKELNSPGNSRTDEQFQFGFVPKLIVKGSTGKA